MVFPRQASKHSHDDDDDVDVDDAMMEEWEICFIHDGGGENDEETGSI